MNKRCRHDIIKIRQIVSGLSVIIDLITNIALQFLIIHIKLLKDDQETFFFFFDNLS